jgi:hypothetical protein
VALPIFTLVSFWIAGLAMITFILIRGWPRRDHPLPPHPADRFVFYIAVPCFLAGLVNLFLTGLGSGS